MTKSNRPIGAAPWRTSLHDVIFEAETPAGRAFDVVLIAAIVVSVGVVMVDTIASVSAVHGPVLRRLEWMFTLLFTVEYVLRLATVRSPRAYALSFYGLIDLFSVLPTYLSLVVPGGQYLLVIRVLRVLRVFRVLKLAQYMGEASVLVRAMAASRYKITVFLFTVVTAVVIVGSVMYLVEGPDSGFTSIPLSVYWAVVTMTTVGYGDISPQTPLGQFLAAAVMIMGYGIIAVPTGIVSVELAQAARKGRGIAQCLACGCADHSTDARFCRICGARVERAPAPGGAGSEPAA